MPKKPVIYIVTDGDYSEYSICAVFSTKAKADAYTERCGGRVEKWIIDEHEGWIMRPYYCCRINLDSGEVDFQWTLNELASPTARVPRTRPFVNRQVAIGYSYVGADHARKIAVERRQEWIRKKGLDTKLTPVLPLGR